jgi:hypothetical protein
MIARIISAAAFIASSGVASDANSQATGREPSSVRAELPAVSEVVNGRAEHVTYRGVRAVKLIPAPAVADKDVNVLALLDRPEFTDGTIQIDVAGAPRPDAPPDSRGFIGISFRTGAKGEWSEVFYLRPTNARADDQLRRNRSLQYVSDPEFPWHRLRRESPGMYESYVDMEAGAWTTMKIVVSGTSARLYVNGASQPCLVVKDLKHGAGAGRIALWAHVETDAYFGPITIEETTSQGTQPRDRQLPVFVFDSLRDRLVLFGGLVNPDVADVDPRTYAFADGRWSVIAEKGPHSRDDVAFGYIPKTGGMVFFGGRGRITHRDSANRTMRTAFRETWHFDGMQWALADTLGPNARSHPQGAYDPVRDRFVVFGGETGFGANESLAIGTWEWDGARWQRFDVPGPGSRRGHVMAYDAQARVVVLHGGTGGSANSPLTDTWAWDGRGWRQLASDGPRAIYGAATTAPVGGIVLFGGHTGAQVSPETWYWSGERWSTLVAEGPTPRIFNALATDVRRKRTYSYGGSARRPSGESATFNDLWYFDWVARKWMEASR